MPFEKCLEGDPPWDAIAPSGHLDPNVGCWQYGETAKFLQSGFLALHALLYEVSFQAPEVVSAWNTMVARNEQSTHNYSQFLDSDIEIRISLLGGIAHALLYQRVQSYIWKKLKHFNWGISGTHVDYWRMFLSLFDMSSERDHFLSPFVI